MNLSIVSTMYASAPYLDEFYRRICAAADKITSDYEIVLVNDGSPDESLEMAVALHEQDPRVRVIDLSRNFGHHKAMMTGIAHAEGDLIFLLDCDLEEDPELLESFHEELTNSDADVVYGVQGTRKGNLFERFSGWIFFFCFNLISSAPLPVNVLTIRLMTSRYTAALIQHREREIVISGLWMLTGFEQRALQVEKRDRGKTSYGFARRIQHLVNAVTSFSNVPLVAIFYLGTFIMALSTVAGCYLIIRRVFFGTLLEGWPSLMVSLWFLGGLITFCLGVIGIYLSKIFTETKQRPYTIIRKIYGDKSDTLHAPAPEVLVHDQDS